MENAPSNPRRKRQSTQRAEAYEWVRRRLLTEPASRIRKWITAQYRDAGAAMRAVGVNPKTPEAQTLREQAREHRRWLRKLALALEAQRRPKTKPLYRRTRPGAWGMEVQVYAAQQAYEPDDLKAAA